MAVSLKRAFDMAFAATGLALSSPLWLAIAAAVKMQDGGPVFYGQARVGRNRRTFQAWKFRSMTPDAERSVGPVQAVEHDPRVTPIGRLLRATAMDELPQLWNILIGEMSVVGPRALRPGEIEVRGSGTLVAAEDVEGFDERCSVIPGLTGLAQLYAPRDVSRRSKFRYDRLYVKRQSFGLDMRLVALSFWITLRGTWEERDRKF